MMLWRDQMTIRWSAISVVSAMNKTSVLISVFPMGTDEFEYLVNNVPSTNKHFNNQSIRWWECGAAVIPVCQQSRSYPAGCRRIAVCLFQGHNDLRQPTRERHRKMWPGCGPFELVCDKDGALEMLAWEVRVDKLAWGTTEKRAG